MFNKIGAEFLDIILEHISRSPKEQKIKDLPKHIDQTYRLIKKGYSLTEISNLL